MNDIINSLSGKNELCKKSGRNNDPSKLKFLEAEFLKLRNENTSLKDDNYIKIRSQRKITRKTAFISENTNEKQLGTSKTKSIFFHTIIQKIVT